jgi:hypothetical protein
MNSLVMAPVGAEKIAILWDIIMNWFSNFCPAT